MTYNFSELTPESQRLIYLRLAAFDAAANWLALFSETDIVQVRCDLVREAFLVTKEVTELEIAAFWLKNSEVQPVEVPA